jgi:hypothetical protein
MFRVEEIQSLLGNDQKQRRNCGHWADAGQLELSAIFGHSAKSLRAVIRRRYRREAVTQRKRRVEFRTRDGRQSHLPVQEVFAA